ncbi:hypothetical protein BHE74_00021282 [Ensete ventricosum]|nr:hypothetical protein BHE74_00021282 [Ensete ventricosum]
MIPQSLLVPSAIIVAIYTIVNAITVVVAIVVVAIFNTLLRPSCHLTLDYSQLHTTVPLPQPQESPTSHLPPLLSQPLSLLPATTQPPSSSPPLHRLSLVIGPTMLPSSPPTHSSVAATSRCQSPLIQSHRSSDPRHYPPLPLLAVALIALICCLFEQRRGH